MAEAIAAAVVSFTGLTGAAAAVVGAAVQVGVYAAANAIVSQNSEKKDQGGLIDLQLNSAAPRQLVVGKRMTGGVLVDWYLAGANNTKLYLPVYLSEGPCGRLMRVFADGREVWSTPLAHGIRTTIPDFRSGGDRLWLTYYDGRVGQLADATLVGLSQGWTSANKLTGCAWVLIECQWDSDNMRSPPSLSFEMEGAKLYDRRKDSTAGGSGSHRLSDPATWEFSDNPAVALDHFMLGRYWSGARTFGIGLSADEVPYSYFAAQANVCDEDVDLKAGGTQKRYRANGFILASEDYSSVITKLCTAMAARPADFGGRFGVIGVESKTPVLTIDDGDLIAGVQEVYTPKRSWAELVGEVEGRFQDPAQLYQPTPYPNVTDAAWATEDGGEPKLITLDLEFETNVERAQRLALLKARAERRQATLRGVYPLWTVELERGDWFVRTGTKWGEGGKTFEVIERVLDPATYTVTIVSQEADAADSAWDESVAADGPPAPLDPTDTLSTVAAPSLTVTSNPIVGAASNTPALKIAFTNPTDPRVHTMFVEVYRNSDGLKVATVPVTIPDTDEEVIIQNGIADGVLYDVRAKYLTPGLSSAWSTTASATTGSTYAVGSVAYATEAGAAASGSALEAAIVAAGASADADAAAAAASALAAAGSATTAASHATNAATAETNAETAQTAAEAALSSATTQATNAATSATSAGSSATSAAGSATTATTQAGNAATSASAALASQTAAAGSASAASSSASSAAASQSAAASSASAASTSATNAATSAGSASTSATSASNSATTAAGHASTASTAATNAASSQSAAAGSASAASSSASTASTQASNAATSASAASTSATNAATQASNASTSAGAASTSAGNAAASATTASTQASNAAGSASSASSSASAASASATAAASSATLSAAYATSRSDALPATFDADGLLFTGQIATIPGTQLTGSFYAVTGKGRVFESTGTVNFAPKVKITLQAGRTYETYWSGRIAVDKTNGINPNPYSGFYAFDASDNLLGLAGIYGYAAKAAADGWLRIGGTITTAAVLASFPTAAFVRPFAGPTGDSGSNAVAQSVSLETRDVTDIVTLSANVATNSSAIATETSARAAAVMTLTAQMQSPGGSLFPNSFLNQSVTSGAPTGWVDPYGNGASLGVATARIDGAGGNAFRHTAHVSAASGIALVAWTPAGSLLPGGKYKLRLRGALVSGSWAKAAPVLYWGDAAAGSISYEIFYFGATADTSGITSNTQGGLRTWEVTFTAPALTSRAYAYLLANDGTGTTAVFDWHECSLIPMSSADASVVTNAAAIATVDGKLSASYGLTVDANGRIASMKLLSNGATSSVKFTADTFQIYNGTTDVPMFEVSGGAAYVAGSKVRTESMAANAVTQGIAGETDASVNVLNSSWVELEAENITLADAAALVKIDWSFFVAVSGEPEDDLLVRIKRGSTVIYETTAARVPAMFSFFTTETGQMDFAQTFTGQVAGFDTDAPGAAGTYTYTLEAKADLSTIGPWTISRRRLFLMQFKR